MPWRLSWIFLIRRWCLRSSARLRRMFDLDADLALMHGHLANDPLLARLIAERPGLRIPGAWDGLELAFRAVLGQQITRGCGDSPGGETGCAIWRAAGFRRCPD